MPIEANFYLPSICKESISKEVKRVKKRDRLSISSTQKGVDIAFKCK